MGSGGGVRHLFDSSGHHIANELDGRLFAPRGRNIGHRHPKADNAYVDMSGRYLGELVGGDRIMVNKTSPWASISLGGQGDHGDIGNRGNPGVRPSIVVESGFADVETPWLSTF